MQRIPELVPLIFIDDTTCVADSVTINRSSGLKEPSKLELANSYSTQKRDPGLSIGFTTKNNIATTLFGKEQVPVFICFEDKVLEIHNAIITRCQVSHGECDVKLEAMGETVVSLERFK